MNPNSGRDRARPGRLSPAERRRRAAALGISDPRVLAVLERMPRERYTAAHHGRGAPIELTTLAKMLQGLELTGTEHVLDVGTGSGYRAALLGALARDVLSVEIDPELVAGARRALKAAGVRNVRVVEGDGFAGWAMDAPYQAILVGGAVPSVPTALIDQLDLGGRLVVPVGDERAQLLERLRRHREGVEADTLAACRLAPLGGRRSRPSTFPWLRPKPHD